MRESITSALSVATPEAMRQLGAQLGRAIVQIADAPVCVFLEGELGAGKTTLVSGVLAAFEIAGPARSPNRADCGFAASALRFNDTHPSVAWLKFAALAEGARLASKQLWN